jgi:phage-related protein
MTDTFTWPTTSSSSGGGSFRTKKAQFGDGYSQEVEDGLNAEDQTATVMVEGTEAELQPVVDFARAHKAESFLWTPPFSTEGLYRCRSFKWAPLSGGYQYTLTLEFVKTYVP